MSEATAAPASTESSVNPERIAIEISGGVADVRLVRGEKHNALDYEMFVALDAATDELEATHGLRAVVLSGDGPSFCSGLDFPSFMERGEDLRDVLFGHKEGEAANLAQRVTYDWQRLKVPVIGALHGNCIGGGSQLALAPDIRIAAPDTRISVMEIKYGLVPDMGITQSLPGLVPMDVAKELIWTGRFVDAEEAVALGLFTRIADDPHAAALELATEIASKSPHAIQAGKKLLDRAYRGRPEDALALEEELQRDLIGSPNQIAAVTAAMTKQPAEFSDPE